MCFLFSAQFIYLDNWLLKSSLSQDVYCLQNLEETVSTLRKLLSSREQEVHELTAQLRDLREINQSLKQDLEHARSRRTPLGTEEVNDFIVCLLMVVITLVIQRTQSLGVLVTMVICLTAFLWILVTTVT